jgi:hypothetical protein
MDDLRTKLEDVRERIAHYTQLLEASQAAAAKARALLDLPSTYPRPRRELEAELHTAEVDCQWIRIDLAALVSRERLLESGLGDEMARDLELRAVEAARAAKAGKAKGKATKRAEVGTPVPKPAPISDRIRP